MRLALMVSLSLLVSVAQAAPLSYEARLRKLSMHLRGYPPALTEYSALADVHSEADFSALWTSKVQDYQRSREYHGKMLDRLYELFLLRKPNVTFEALQEEQATLEALTPEARQQLAQALSTGQASSLLTFNTFTLNSLDFLFQSLTRENKPWFSLLESSDYEISANGGVGQSDDFSFFAPVESCTLTPQPQAEVLALLTGRATAVVSPVSLFVQDPFDTRLKLSCPATETRAGGAVTTRRFLSRYSRSAANKNFKRAAAVYRIFLCDDMRPMFRPGSEDEETARQAHRFAILGDLARPAATDPGTTPAEAAAVENHRHASDTSCRGCHNKLDPMADLFNNVAYTLSPLASAGAIVFSGRDLRQKSVPVAGLGELGRKLSGIREVKQCQVRHFWDWFIGNDVPLSDERMDQLVRELDLVGFRTNELVAKFVGLPEFSTPPERSGPVIPREVLAAKYETIRPYLTRCTTCHTTFRSGAPVLTKMPFSRDKEEHLRTVQAIARSLDLDHAGANPTMPRQEIWPDKVQVDAAVSDWLCSGAPDAAGDTTVNMALWNPSFCTGGRR